MGPCPFRHGYDTPQEIVWQYGLASMGPCPFRHGYADVVDDKIKAQSELQWGHALSGMDTWRGVSLLRDPYTLQWGHALSGMDTWR